MKDSDFNIVRNDLYLNSILRHEKPVNKFPKYIYRDLKGIFWDCYTKNIESRGAIVKISDKDKNVLNHVFHWAICDPSFEGDLQKGLYLVSRQGYGKDILLRAIVDFFMFFHMRFKEYTHTNFCKEWFNKGEHSFKSPIKINDIKEDGKMKREREAMPFLELMDFREQMNLRRGMIVSSNLLPMALQQELEPNKEQQRTYERIKECFNIVHIKGAGSKRKENKKVL